MRIGLGINYAGGFKEVAAEVADLERAGLDIVFVPEAYSYDAVSALGYLAASTERVELGTSVAIAFPRSPMVVAHACWDLQVASRGRFVLGIGPQIRPHNERRFSVPWTAPAPRLREYVQALRAILGERYGEGHHTQPEPARRADPLVQGAHDLAVEMQFLSQARYQVTVTALVDG